MSVEVIIFYILLIDALGANLVVHFGRALPRDLALVPAGRGLGALLPGKLLGRAGSGKAGISGRWR